MEFRRVFSGNRCAFSCSVAALLVCVPGPVNGYGQTEKPVVVARVIEKEINSGLKVIGTVHPRKKSTIGSAVDGRVREFLVNSGDRVKKGEVLARLRTETLLIEQAAAKAELELARQRLLELENGSRPEDVAEAEANMQIARAALHNAEKKLQRVQALALTNAASSAELDDARERADAARFSLKANEALYQKMREGPRREAVAQAKAQLELQQQRVNLLTDRIAKFEIQAPFDGFVSNEYTEEGAWIKQGDPIVDLIQMNKVEVQAPVVAEVAVHLKKGLPIRVEFPELPEQLLTGTIERIVPSSESRARTFPVFILLDNPIVDEHPLLLGGMLARIDFPAGRRRKLPLVPKDALVLNGNRRSVFVIDGESDPAVGGTAKVRQVDVRLGVALEDRIQVEGELHDGDMVVVVGNERLTDGNAVRISRIAGNRSAARKANQPEQP